MSHRFGVVRHPRHLADHRRREAASEDDDRGRRASGRAPKHVHQRIEHLPGPARGVRVAFRPRSPPAQCRDGRLDLRAVGGQADVHAAARNGHHADAILGRKMADELPGRVLHGLPHAHADRLVLDDEDGVPQRSPSEVRGKRRRHLRPRAGGFPAARLHELERARRPPTAIHLQLDVLEPDVGEGTPVGEQRTEQHRHRLRLRRRGLLRRLRRRQQGGRTEHAGRREHRGRAGREEKGRADDFHVQSIPRNSAAVGYDAGSVFGRAIFAAIRLSGPRILRSQ